MSTQSKMLIEEQLIVLHQNEYASAVESVHPLEIDNSHYGLDSMIDELIGDFKFEFDIPLFDFLFLATNICLPIFTLFCSIIYFLFI